MRNSILLASAISGIALASGITFKSADYKEGPTLNLAQNLVVSPLFIGGYDTVTALKNGQKQKVLSKDWNDFLGFLPIAGSSDSGFILVSHEKIEAHPVLGDGGGMTLFKAAKQKDGKWMVLPDSSGTFKNIDFSPVGGTLANCGGMVTPWGTVVSAEEWGQTSNKGIYKANVAGINASTGKWFDTTALGISDTSDVQVQWNGKTQTIKKYQNFNWMVEVDPKSGKALRKLYGMGRFDHEGGAVDQDSIVYLTDDYTPGVFFKFVADKKGSFETGKLFAYKQGTVQTENGSWIEIPNDLDSLMNARTIALRKGATMFIRLEWITAKDGMIYLTETGRDNAKELTAGQRLGGKLAWHHNANAYRDTTGKSDTLSVTDYFGRVLRFDPSKNQMSVLVEGGNRTDGSNFSNPDGLASAQIGGKPYLLINEDLNGLTQNRVSASALSAKQDVSDVWLLDLSKSNPTRDDLQRLATSPLGAETTGFATTPDGSTLFFNIQHPTYGPIYMPNSSGKVDTIKNIFPYDHSLTVAITGHDLNISTPVQLKSGTLRFNPLSQNLVFDSEKQFALFDSKGKKLLESRAQQVSLSSYPAGRYYLKTSDGDVLSLVR